MTDFFREFCGNSTLWDKTLFNNTYPKLSPCFQNTVMVWVPCGVFWLFIPTWVYTLSSMKDPGVHIHKSKLSIFKNYISFTLCLLTLIDLSKLYIASASDETIPEYKAVVLSDVIKGTTFIAAASVGTLERKKGVVTSGYLFLFWLSMVLTGVVPLYILLIEWGYEAAVYKLFLYSLRWFLLVLQFILHFFADKSLTKSSEKSGKSVCPQVFASFPSKLSFSWMNSLIFLGRKKPLTGDDLWDLQPELKGENVIPQFEELWNQEVEACKRFNRTTEKINSTQRSGQQTRSKIKKEKRQPSLLKVIVKFTGIESLKGIVLRTVFDILQLLNPVLLGLLISYIQNRSNEYTWKGYALAFSFYINAVVMYLLVYYNDINVDTLMMKLKSCLISSVYKKSLRIDNKTKKAYTIGEIINFMTVDFGKIQGINWTFMFCVSIPLRFILCAILLYNALGPTVFAGMALMTLLIPVKLIIANKDKELSRTLMKYRDERSKILTEVLNEMKVVKYYTWESSFQKKITDIRNKELGVMKHLRYMNTSYVLTLGLVPFLVSLVSFIIFIFYQEGNHLDAGKAFIALSLFDNLKFPLYMLPRLITRFTQAKVCMGRVEKFLQSGELDPDNVRKMELPGKDTAIKVVNGTFSWDEKMEPALKRINLEIPKGKLIAVVGQVGAGKSSLLSTFLGHMDKISGEVNVTGTVAYIPQQAWMQNATLKDNILFGKPLDQEKYDSVVEACSLGPDLQMLTAGDMTEIGEKGINLSGGQKQRISLARAVYHNADVYLLDDPLSAVDSHVGKHILENVIGENGLLKNKTRVLVTHGIHLLKKVDGIIVLKHGEILETGTYENLINNNGDFAKLIQNCRKENTHDMTRKTAVNIFEGTTRKDMKDSNSHGAITDDSEKDVISDRMGESKASLNKFYSGSHCKPKNRRDLSSYKQGQLIKEEEISEEKVQFKVFLKYFQAFGYKWILTVFIVSILNEAVKSLTNIMLSWWTEDDLLKNGSLSHTSEYKSRNLMFIALYAAFGLGETFLDLFYALMIFMRGVVASERLHCAMLRNILYCPMAFFDTTPVGRIVNRFISDFDKIDIELPDQIRGVVHQVLRAFATLIVITYNTPMFITVVLPVAFLYRLIRKCFVPTIRQIERIHSKNRSPVYSFFGETIAGASTIKAYGLQDKFLKESQIKVDKTVGSLYALIAAYKWTDLRLECVGNLFVLAAALLSVMSSNISDGMAGLCVAYALQITSSLNGLVNTSAHLEIDAVSVERVDEYTSIKSEVSSVASSAKPITGWPQKGNILIQNYKTRYRPGLELVLKGINCEISAGEKVGIIGRTGAGKSSLMAALFRIIDSVDGKIVIDGEDIAQIDLYYLRSKLTILPQDPVMFSGTLRNNLDPFEKFSSEDIHVALKHAHLEKLVSELPNGLEYECGEKGQNLSVGQRQLVCLARALLNKSKILILDEATAAVDMETDNLIQKTIREEFKECTILTIAHRLKTIMDYDKILVLGDGRVLEHDSPQNLLQKKSSVFYGMVKESDLKVFNMEHY